MHKFNLFVQEENNRPEAVPTVSKKSFRIEVQIDGLHGFNNGK